jgi:hypothetical protein
MTSAAWIAGLGGSTDEEDQSFFPSAQLAAVFSARHSRAVIKVKDSKLSKIPHPHDMLEVGTPGELGPHESCI